MISPASPAPSGLSASPPSGPVVSWAWPGPPVGRVSWFCSWRKIPDSPRRSVCAEACSGHGRPSYSGILFPQRPVLDRADALMPPQQRCFQKRLFGHLGSCACSQLDAHWALPLDVCRAAAEARAATARLRHFAMALGTTNRTSRRDLGSKPCHSSNDTTKHHARLAPRPKTCWRTKVVNLEHTVAVAAVDVIMVVAIVVIVIVIHVFVFAAN